MKKILKLLGKIADIVSHISLISMIAVMLLIVVNIFLRYAFNKPILGAYEIVERGMFCLVFASFAYGQSKKSHVHVTMIISVLPQKLRFLCYSFTSLLSSGLAFTLTYAAYIQTIYSYEASTVTASLFIPLYPFFALEALSMLVFSVILLADTIYSVIAIFNKEYAADIQSTWA